MQDVRVEQLDPLFDRHVRQFVGRQVGQLDAGLMDGGQLLLLDTSGSPCARRAVQVITVSEFSRGELIELGGLDPERLSVIAGGVGEAFSPARDRPTAGARPADADDADDAAVARRWGLERPYVLTIATTDTRKNLRLSRTPPASSPRSASTLPGRGYAPVLLTAPRRPPCAPSGTFRTPTCPRCTGARWRSCCPRDMRGSA